MVKSICNFQKEIFSKSVNNSQSIDYQVILDGFVEIDDPSAKVPLSGELFVFNSEEQWEKFTQKYFRGLPSLLSRLSMSVDFKKQKLICKLISPTHENYNIASTVDNVLLVNNTLAMNFSEDKSNTYVLGSNNEISIFFYIVLATIDNTEQRSTLDNNYQ